LWFDLHGQQRVVHAALAGTSYERMLGGILAAGLLLSASIRINQTVKNAAAAVAAATTIATLWSCWPTTAFSGLFFLSLALSSNSSTAAVTCMD
jgi:hypothetical protein